MSSSNDSGRARRVPARSRQDWLLLLGLGLGAVLSAQSDLAAEPEAARTVNPTPSVTPAASTAPAGALDAGTAPAKPVMEAAVPAPAPPALEVITASLTLKVKVPEEAATALVAKAEALGGYFSRRTHQQLVLKVPAQEVNTWIAYASTLGVVADRSFERQNVSQQLVEARSRLAAREEVMKRYLEVLQEAGTSGVLQVEQEVNRMVGEIEQIKGQLRLTEHRISLAEISVSFQFRDRAAPLRDGRSSFPWLNTVNLADLVEDFQYAH